MLPWPLQSFSNMRKTYDAMQHAPEPPIKDPAAEDASKSDALRIYSMEEVEKHDTRDSAWFVHHGQVWPLLIILNAFRCCTQCS